MRCPEDHSKLIAYTIHGFELDACEKCHGVWYDQDEFGGLLKTLAHWELPNEYQVITSPRQAPLLQQTQARVCPRDNNPFSTYQYAVNSGVHIDRCGKCNGIWLDGGELHRIQEFRKPNEDMRKLAEALLEHHRSAEELKEMVAQAPFVLMAPLFFLPYTTTLARERFPWLTTLFIAVNTIVFFAFIFGKQVEELQVLFQTFGFVPSLAVSGSDLYRFFTSMFLHADIFHLLGNMLFLWVFGRNLEERIGFAKFVVLYAFSGIVAVLTHTILHQGGTLPVIGASGAVSGIMGGYILLFPSSKVKGVIYNIPAFVLGARIGLKPVIKVPAWYYLGGWFLLQLFFSLLYETGGGVASGIAFFAHVGGFIGGLALAKLLQTLKII